VDTDKLKGKLKDIGGRVERQAGEWTGDKDTQAEGMADQAEGKVQNAWGKAKDAGRDVVDNLKRRGSDAESQPRPNSDVEREDKDRAA
jgi:uncharacterized protein YjbJ (UPF0337 family)